MGKKSLMIWAQLSAIVIAACVINQPVFASSLRNRVDRVANSPPEPMLIFPANKTVNLAGKDFLEFKWRGTYDVQMSAYEFRLYKGYQPYSQDLLLKKSLPADSYSLKLNAALFTDGQAYTWSLMEISNGGQKSDRAFGSFRVTKK
ncbi:MAG: hypothetical protein ACM3IL_05435 [Deltaproteobacteria bacterium]